MNPEEVIAGSFYTLKEPQWATTFGQGEPPAGMKISFPEKDYFLPWNTVFKASGTCDPDYKIANMNASPYPLAHVDFIKSHAEQFEAVITEAPAADPAV
jgi:hypothetical protein